MVVNSAGNGIADERFGCGRRQVPWRLVQRHWLQVCIRCALRWAALSAAFGRRRRYAAIGWRCRCCCGMNRLHWLFIAGYGAAWLAADADSLLVPGVVGGAVGGLVRSAIQASVTVSGVFFCKTWQIRIGHAARKPNSLLRRFRRVEPVGSAPI